MIQTKKKESWATTVITLFPEMFPGPLKYSISGRALEENVWALNTVQIRDFALDKHRTVDDTCFGGGAGMLLKPDVVHGAVSEAVSQGKNRPLIYLTPRGKPLNQKTVRRLALETPGIILLCGRYEGVDQRLLDFWDFEEISIGDYILSGGEMAALTLLDACIRLIPGVIGKEESLSSESFETGLLEYPQYTRPQAWNNKIVPDVLLSGDHQKIAKWRQEEAEKITQIRRPDLWAKYLESKKVI